MSGFDTVLVVDWSAGKRRPKTPSKDAIWIGIARAGTAESALYCRSRIEAEAQIHDLLDTEQAAGRRVLASFDFPFGYPAGFARHITGSDDPFALWQWVTDRITDDAAGCNNRYAVAEALNAHFNGLGPFWGKPNQTDWPGIPYRKAGITFDTVAERRACDLAAKAASSCFQLAFPPTVGGQILMGLPTLTRLRARGGVAVWPFEPWQDAPVVLAEIWPGLIEPAVRTAQQAEPDAIRDKLQVEALARALSRMPAESLVAMMQDVPEIAAEEAWILGTGHGDALSAFAMPGRLRNDCFALPPGVHWTPVDTALADLRARLAPMVGTESLPLMEARGRILARDVVAARSHPPQANTAVDGYGFAGAKEPGSHEMPLLPDQILAGAAPTGPVPPGHAVRIMTGAALPKGVDTVILQEDVTQTADQIAFDGPLKHGANTRAAGEDVAAGDTVLKAGRRLTAADLALISAVGVPGVQVFNPLRVGVLSTGDEVVDPEQDAALHQIYDANRPMLLGLISDLGHCPVDLGRVPDDRAALRAALDLAAADADVILTSGGASAGEADHVSALLQEAGAMAQWRVALKPGRPLALGVWRGRPVFGLPGNPVAAIVCTLVFAAPALALMSGAGWWDRQGYDLPAAFEKRKKAGRREFLRARVRAGRVEVFPSEGSGRVSGLSWAEGLVELPDAAAHIRPGDRVRFIPWSGFGP